MLNTIINKVNRAIVAMQRSEFQTKPYYILLKPEEYRSLYDDNRFESSGNYTNFYGMKCSSLTTELKSEVSLEIKKLLETGPHIDVYGANGFYYKRFNFEDLVLIAIKPILLKNRLVTEEELVELGKNRYTHVQIFCVRDCDIDNFLGFISMFKHPYVEVSMKCQVFKKGKPLTTNRSGYTYFKVIFEGKYTNRNFIEEYIKINAHIIEEKFKIEPEPECFECWEE